MHFLKRAAVAEGCVGAPLRKSSPVLFFGMNENKEREMEKKTQQTERWMGFAEHTLGQGVGKTQWVL